MKTKNLLRVVAIFVITALGLSFFSACEEKENDNTNWNTNGAKKWECVLSDDAKITLDMYDADNKYYSTVSGTPDVDILFVNNNWEYYQMNGDTMIIVKSGDIIIDPDDSSPKWIISKPSDSVMTMEYFGILPAVATLKTEYMFNLR